MPDESPKPPMTYAQAGLNLDTYEDSLDRIRRVVKRTHDPMHVLDGFGGFASLFALDYDRFLFSRKYKKPVLVTCTDGVGSKLKIATLTGKYDTVGIDLVAMSVNDCICTGGEPLVFLDYLAMPKDDPVLVERLLKGMADGCLDAGCSLTGGELAILPDVYAEGDFDLAGFCLGVVERDHVVNGQNIQPGDIVIGLSSTGLHSNGYTLARNIAFGAAGLKHDTFVEELGKTVGEEFLTPTRIYVRAVKSVLSSYPVKRKVVRGLAHITGGGIVDNLPRVLPPNRRAFIRRGSWPVPPVFGWLQKLGNVAEAEMDRVFNGGIGFCIVVAPHFAAATAERLTKDGYPAHLIGEIREGEAGVEWLK